MMTTALCEGVAEAESVVDPQEHPTAVQLSQVELSWSQASVPERLKVLRRARHLLASRAERMASVISQELARSTADTMVAEVLPLLDACRYLEQNASAILRTRRLGRKGRPFWLADVTSEIHRVPFCRVLVIGPANYPLLLPGVQTLQALAAGNAVVWKPGRGGSAAAQCFAQAMRDAGLAAGLLQVTDDSVEAAEPAIADGVGKVFFTGSARSGRMLMRRLAESATPCVAELSGCDGVVVLPDADLCRVVKALAFGMRLNGSATCMAPRRVLLVGASANRSSEFFERLRKELAQVPEVVLPDAILGELDELLRDAESKGGTIVSGRNSDGKGVTPIVVAGGTPEMELAGADTFAPVLTIFEIATEEEAIRLQERCPMALTVSIFGDERKARELAGRMTSGTVVINDVIVPSADPRVPFGGRRGSGFGVTRGAEGLLEMTAVKVVEARRGRSTRHYEATGPIHGEMFAGVIAAIHAGSWSDRLKGAKRMMMAARRLGSRQ